MNDCHICRCQWPHCNKKATTIYQQNGWCDEHYAKTIYQKSPSGEGDLAGPSIESFPLSPRRVGTLSEGS